MSDVSGSFHFDEVMRRVDGACVEGLGDAIAHVLTVANGRVPTDEGDLAASGDTDVDAGSFTAAAGYGGGFPLNVYSVIQHEDMDLHHDDGQPKFLESAGNGEKRQITSLFVAALKRRT